LTFNQCKDEIIDLVNIWSAPIPKNQGEKNLDDPTPEDLLPACIFNAMGDELSSLFKNPPFLDNGAAILNKIGLEINSSLWQCDKIIITHRRRELTTLQKLAYSIIDRSKCERSFATILLLVNHLQTKSLSPYENIFYTLLSADHVLNVYDNCQAEVNLILDLIKS